MRFTGHERDLVNLSGQGDDLDYMHARHYGVVTGRFLSVDTGSSARLSKPQTWNRYSYSRNNPMTRLDPDGKVDQNFLPLEFPDDPVAQAEFDSQVLQGTIAIAAILAPGPEDFLIAGAIGRFGRLLANVLGKADEVPAKAISNVANDLEGLSKRNIKHIQQHLGEFQELDKTFTLERQIDVGRQIAANDKNLIGTSGGRKIYEAMAKVGNQLVKVKVVVNANGGIRSIFIPRS